MVKFISYLYGTKGWIHPQQIAPEIKEEDTLASTLRNILGTKDLQNCITLYHLCASIPHIYSKLPKETTPLNFSGILFPATSQIPQGKLETTGIAPGYSAPIVVPPQSKMPITILYKTDTTGELRYGNKKVIVAATKVATNTLIVNWPADLQINGTINLGNIPWQLGARITVPTRFAYDIVSVDKALRATALVYDALERYGLCSIFYSADTPEERIGICTLLLIAHVK